MIKIVLEKFRLYVFFAEKGKSRLTRKWIGEEILFVKLECTNFQIIYDKLN